MKTKIYLILIFFITSASSYSQFTQEWAKRYSSSGTADDYVSAMTNDEQGNIYVTGRANGDYMTIKYSPAGDILWQASYNGPANDADDAYAICVDNAGNVYITGRSFGNGTENDIATIKYSPVGAELWVQRFNGSNNSDDKGAAIAVDAAGNVYVGGSAVRTTTDYVLLKYSSSGSQVWARYYDGPDNRSDFANTMIMDAQGNIYLSGTSQNSNVTKSIETLKYSSAGTVLWSARYSTGDNAEPAEIRIDGSGNVYIAGSTHSPATGQDIVAIKYNNAGVQQWAKVFNRTGDGDDFGSGICIDASGSKIYVCGYSAGSIGGFDFTLLQYNSNGTLLWSKFHSGPVLGGDDQSRAVEVDSYGYVYITGRSVTSGSDHDFLTLKYSEAGDMVSSVLYESPVNGDDIPTAMILESNGNIAISGWSTGFSGKDFLTVKYSQPIGIQNISNEVPQGFELKQNYPNPFNPVTNIEFSIAKTVNVKLSIFDVSGKEISVPVNGQLSAGTYKVDFDASALSSGTYFYRLEAGSNSEVKKMILVK